MVKPATVFHQAVEHHLTSMPKGRVPQIMGQANSFEQVFVSTQSLCQCAPYLGDFEGVGQPCAEIIALEVDEHLGFVLQAAESGSVQDAVAVTLKCSAISRLVIRMLAPFAVLTADSVSGKGLILDLFEAFSCVNHF